MRLRGPVGKSSLSFIWIRGVGDVCGRRQFPRWTKVSCISICHRRICRRTDGLFEGWVVPPPIRECLRFCESGSVLATTISPELHDVHKQVSSSTAAHVTSKLSELVVAERAEARLFLEQGWGRAPVRVVCFTHRAKHELAIHRAVLRCRSKEDRGSSHRGDPTNSPLRL